MNVMGNYSAAVPAYGGTKAATERARTGDSFFSSMADMRRQLADPGSDFYRETKAAMLRTVKENDERRKEEAVVDALATILDSMARSSQTEAGQDVERAGIELGIQTVEPEEPEELGGFPWDPMKTAEMQAFAAALADRGTFRLTESETETEAEKVRESGEERRVLSEEEIAELAEKYDPREMTANEFRDFMDTLAADGVLDSKDAEGIKNIGQWVITVQDRHGSMIEPLRWRDSESPPVDMIPFLFGEHSMKGDVLAWAQFGGSNNGFQDLLSVLSQMESFRAENQQSNPK